jgi:hypothetical protein
VNAGEAARPRGATASREQHFSVAEIAKDWGFGETLVRKLFADEEGVLKVTSFRAKIMKNSSAKPRVSLRISASARDRVYASLAGGFASKLKATSRRVE